MPELTETPLPYGLKYFHEVLPRDLCSTTIEIFEKLPKTPNPGRVQGKPNAFAQVQFPDEVMKAHPVLQRVYGLVRAQIDTYLDETVACPDLRQKLKEGCYTLNPRIKRYDQGQSFPLHSDDSSVAAIARRFAFIAYLNDDFQGGETVFKSGQGEIARITPKTGSLLVFPVSPIYMHEGETIKAGKKYIFNGFMSTITSQGRMPLGVRASKKDIVAQEIAMLLEDLLQGAHKVF